MKKETGVYRWGYFILVGVLVLSFACGGNKKHKVTAEIEKPKDTVKEVTEKPEEIFTPEEPQITEEISSTTQIQDNTFSNTSRLEEISSHLEDIHFSYNKYNLTPQAREALANNARYLMDNPGVSVQIEGHCDERGTGEYNLALGEKRALSTKAYLEALGVPVGRLNWITYGEEKPVNMGSNEAAWAENRRAHLKPE